MNCPHCGAAVESSPVEVEAFMTDGGTPKAKAIYSQCAADCGWSSITFDPALPFTPASIELEKP
jgi:hypothetical protein